jgi:hypothetical protein
MAEAEDMLKSKDISEESDGSWIVDLKKHTGKPGRELYETATEAELIT